MAERTGIAGWVARITAYAQARRGYLAVGTVILLVALGQVPAGLTFEQIYGFAGSWVGKCILFLVIFLPLWHAAHRLRVVFHDFGVRRDKAVANAVYLVAAIGTVMTAFYLYRI